MIVEMNASSSSSSGKRGLRCITKVDSLAILCWIILAWTLKLRGKLRYVRMLLMTLLKVPFGNMLHLLGFWSSFVIIAVIAFFAAISAWSHNIIFPCVTPLGCPPFACLSTQSTGRLFSIPYLAVGVVLSVGLVLEVGRNKHRQYSFIIAPRVSHRKWDLASFARLAT